MLFDRLPAMRDVAMTLAIVAIALFAHHAYIQLVQPDVPYMDSMRMLVFQQGWREGKLSLYDLWEPGSPHHGLLNPMLLAANVQWFGLDAKLATFATGWVIAAMCVLIAFAFLGDRRGPMSVDANTHWLPRMFAVALLTMLLFSWAGFELLTLELGLALWVKNLCFVLFFLAHAAWVRKPVPDVAGSVALSLAGVAIVLLIGGGWGYGFVDAVIATQVLVFFDTRGRDRGAALALRWLPAIALVIALVCYAAAGEHHDTGARAPIAFSSLLLPLYGLGSTWIGSEAFAHHHYSYGWMLLAGCATALAGAWALYRRWRRGFLSGSLFPITLMAYGASTAVLFAIARGGWGIPGVVASRYFMDIVLFTIGTLWLLFEDAQVRRDRAVRVSSLACLALAAGLVAGQAWTYRMEWVTAPFRAQAFDRMEQVFRSGATTPADARMLQSWQPYAREAVAIMRARRLSIFRDDDVAECRVAAVHYAAGWYPKEGDNRWMGEHASVEVPPCGCAATAQVFIPKAFVPREIQMDLGQGKPASFALAPGKMATLQFPASTRWQQATLTVSQATQPMRDLPGSADKRTLGALLGPVRFECAAPVAAQ